MTAGKSYRISCDIKDGTSASQTMNLTAGTGMNGESSSSNLTTTASWVTHTYEFVAGAGYNTISIKSLMTGAGNIEIKNYSVVPIGAVAEYDGSSAGSHQWGDKSGNELHGTVGDGAGGATAPTLENTPYDTGTEYEEGTFTPFLSRVGGAITSGVSYSRQNGEYTRIGNVCYIWFDMVTDTFSSVDSSGTFLLAGLPFTVETPVVGGYGAPSFRAQTAISTTYRAYSSSSYFNHNDTTIALYWFTSGGVETAMDTETTDIGVGRLTGSGFYYVD